MKTYTFYEEGYYFSNGCDCCEDVYMECYNSNDVMRGLGSAHSLEECYMQALITETNNQNEYPKFYEMDMEELEMKARELSIEVVIIS